MTNLSVNLNKVALLRNQRDIGYPNVIEHAKLILDAGANGLTVHPRPDARHIRVSDVRNVSDFIIDYDKPGIEFNVEGYPDEDFLNLVTKVKCHQVTLVPDDPNQRTSDHGWNIPAHKEFLIETIKRLQGEGRRVSLFVDPDDEAVKHAADVKAERIELYTGPYGYGWEEDDFGAILNDYTFAAETAAAEGVEVNAGHDLNLDNLGTFLEHVPQCLEVSIGHAITDDALKLGWGGAVTAYLDVIETSRKNSAAA